jgi:hypothetical protein
MPAYDRTLFDPSAPLAKVTIRHPLSGATISDVPMLLDTGINGDPSEGYELKGFDGNVSVARVVEVDLLFLRRAFKGRFLLIDQEWGLIGRDVLNHVSLLFDGVHLEWSEQK